MPDPNTEHGLRVQLATALRERDAEKARADAASDRLETAARAYIEGHELALTRAEAAESERDSLRTALAEIINLVMDVPGGEDWRAKVGDRARLALHGPPGWERK